MCSYAVPFFPTWSLYPSLSKSSYLWTFVYMILFMFFKNLNMRPNFFFFQFLCTVFCSIFFSLYLYHSFYPFLEREKKKHICIFSVELKYILYQKWECFQEATKLMHEFYAGTFENALRSKFHHFKVSVSIECWWRKFASHHITS